MTAPCVFCTIIEDETFEEHLGHAVVFAPLHPVTPGHLLVVPVRHVRDALEEPELTGLVLAAAARLARDRALFPCNFITSAGIEATQTVFHLHLHIVPRRPGDGLALPWTGQRKFQVQTFPALM